MTSVAPSESPTALLRRLCGASVVAAMDPATLGSLLPAVRASHELDLAASTWLISAYVLGGLVGTPYLTARARGGHAQRSLHWALLATALGALLFATAPGFPLVLVGRVLAGFGSTALLPLGAVLVGESITAQRGRALVLLGLAYTAPFLLGPFLVWLLPPAAWRALPALTTAVAVWLLWASGPTRSTDAHAQRGNPDKPPLGVDAFGLVAWLVGLAACSVALQGAQGGTGAPWLLATSGAVGLLSIATFLWRQHHSRTPLLATGLWYRSLATARCGALALAIGLLQAQLIVLPSYGLYRAGTPAEWMALLPLPLVLAGIAFSVAQTRLIERTGPIVILTLGAVAALAADLRLSLGVVTGVELWLQFALFGFGLSGLGTGALREVALRVVSPDEASAMQGLLAVTTNLGVLLGSAMFGVAAASAADTASGIGAGYRWTTVLLALCSSAIVGLRADPPTSRG